MLTYDIAFKNKDSDGVEVPTFDPMVIMTVIGSAMVHWVLVDNGSSVNIMFKRMFVQMKISMKDVKS